ncbi:MAG: hypothetical protein DIU70_013475, partial [Bacillota bacterium]
CEDGVGPMILHWIMMGIRLVAGLGVLVALVHFLQTLRWGILGIAGLFLFAFFWPSLGSEVLDLLGPWVGSRVVPNNKTGVALYLLMVLAILGHYLYHHWRPLLAAGRGEAAAAAEGGKGRRRRRKR